MLGITTTNARVGGFRGGISAEAKTIYNRIIADGGVSNLTRLNFFVKGLKAIYGDLANVPVCYDAHWIGYKLGSGTGATAGQAAAKLYSLTVAGDAVQSTAASQPLLLAHNGDNYYYNDDTGTSSISKSISNISTGTNYVFEFGLDSAFASGSIRTIASHGLIGGNGSGIWIRWTSNVLVFDYRNPRVEVNSNTINANSRFFKIEYIKNSGISYTITFSEKVNIGDSYTINKTATVTVTTTTMDSINTAWMGSLGSSFGLLGKLLFVNCTVDGNSIYNFQASNYLASTSQTTLPDGVSGNWTINTGTATTGYKGQLVSKTIVMSDGVDDRLTSSAITSISNRTNYLAVITWVSTNANYFMDGSVVASNGVLTGNPNRIGIITNAATTTYADFVNRLKLSTTKLSGTTQGAAINNGTETTATVVSPLAFTSVNLGSAFGGIAFINAVFSTIAISNSADDSTNRTAMYNLIRSLNENAF